MPLSKDDLDAIRKIVRNEIDSSLKEWFHFTANPSPTVSESRWADQILEKFWEKQQRQDQLDSEIRQRAETMPAEYRPRPEQYKSESRKREVLRMVKDPTLWDKIPHLADQWIQKPRKKTAT